MIHSFSCKNTQELFKTGRSLALASLQGIAQRKLQQLDCAVTLAALQVPYGNAFKNAPNREAKHSICIEEPWRLYFVWSDKGPAQVAIANTQALGNLMSHNNMPPTHPGEILQEDYLWPLRMSATTLAEALHVPLSHIEALLRHARPVDPEMALRLAQYFGGDAQSWLNLQQSYDLKLAEQAMQQTIIDTIKPAFFGEQQALAKTSATYD